MSIRDTRRRKLKKSSIGDMRSLITIWERAIDVPFNDYVSPRENYKNPVQEWAKIDTVNSPSSGQEFFDNVNIATPIYSHVFTIRFDSNYTSENIIEWDNNYYKILKVTNPESRNEYLEFYTVIKGDKDLEANQ